MTVRPPPGFDNSWARRSRRCSGNDLIIDYELGLAPLDDTGAQIDVTRTVGMLNLLLHHCEGLLSGG